VAGDLLLGHAEIRSAMRDEHVELLEGAFVQKHFDALARGQLALGMLSLDTALAAAKASFRAAFLQLFENRTHQSISRLGKARDPAAKSRAASAAFITSPGIKGKRPIVSTGLSKPTRRPSHN